MAEPIRDTIEIRKAEREAIIREAAELAHRADVAGLPAIARVLDLAIAMMDGEPWPQPHAQSERH
jgi:hypothetical protein